MKIPRAPHRWSVSPKRAIEIQRELSRRVIRRGRVARPRLAAGVDLAFSEDQTEALAGVVLWDVSTRKVLEQHVARRPVRFPYVPGLLSFREAPAILSVIRILRREPDVFLLDGHGYAHPRRFGLACHVGLILDIPSIGCAKSILVGEHRALNERRGSLAPLEHGGECVGMAVRTRNRVKPVYVSVGHRLSLRAAVEITLACGDGYRIPEPTRRADQLVAMHKLRTS